MRKDELRSVIFNLLPKYFQGTEYHKEVIDRAIEKVINQLYTETFLRDPHSINRYVKRFGTTTPIIVSHDANAGIYYSSYSSLGTNPRGYAIMPISLPDNASGIRRITTKVQGGIRFYPMSQTQMELVLGSVMVNTVTDKIGYVVTQDRVEYYGMTAAIAADGVRMDCVIPFSGYTDTDQILIPEIPDAQGETFSDMVLKILGVIRPQETKDDNLTTVQQTKQ